MMLDDIMRHTSIQYSTLKHSWAGNLRDGFPQSGIVTNLLEASTAVNMGILFVQFPEQNLTLNYPHMNTIYRLMAVLVFHALTAQLTEMITKFTSL